MDEYETNEILLDPYIRSLENQIENKKYFLKQTNNAIDKLKQERKGLEGGSEIEESIWQEFLKKSMFSPDRSDPIGISLASSSLQARNTTSEETLSTVASDIRTFKGYSTYLTKVNNNLEELIDLINEKLDKEVDIDEVDDMMLLPHQKNRKLHKLLNIFIEECLSVDLMTSDEINSEKKIEDIKFFLLKLINHDDNLRVSDLVPDYKGLYRLLVKTHIVDIVEQKNGEKFIKLLDFADMNLL